MRKRKRRLSKMRPTIISWPNYLWQRFVNFSQVLHCMASSIWFNEIDRFTKSEFYEFHSKFTCCHLFSFCDRILWYFALSIAMASTVYIFLTALDGFSSKPAFTSLKSVKHPIGEVPFPAVAICGVNKISKRGARKYAQYL